MDDVVWKILAGVASFSTLALWREYTARVKHLEKRISELYESKWPELEDRTTALELHRQRDIAEAEKAERRYNKTMRVLNAMLWAMTTDDRSKLDPDSLFKD